MAMPTPAKSWWLQVPLILTGLPFREKPLSASKRMVLTPKSVVAWSATRSPTRIERRQPRVAVDAAAVVPPAFPARGIEPDGGDVGLPWGGARGDVVADWCVAALVETEEFPVEPHPARAVDTVEFEPEPLAGRR